MRSSRRSRTIMSMKRYGQIGQAGSIDGDSGCTFNLYTPISCLLRFCPKCIAWATDPDNERPPHHPLVATLDKKNFPPRSRIPLEGAQSDLKRSSSRATSPSSVKKPRLHSPLSDLSEATTHQGELDESKTINGDGRAQTVESDGKSQSRPKRQAAMHRPDYHALHHHIATPTGKWLDLIANPAAYGMVIREGERAHLTRMWSDRSL